jgi:hypothetical protein
MQSDAYQSSFSRTSCDYFNWLGESVVVTTGKVKRSFGKVPGCVSVTENRRNADELRLFSVLRLPSLDHKVPTLAEAGTKNPNREGIC